MSAVFVNGAFVGLVYGLVGIGLVLVYRGSRVVNFAYGEFGMVAAYVYADLRYGSGGFSGPPEDNGLWPSLPVAIASSAAIGVAVEMVLIRKLRDAPRTKALVGTFAIASLLLVFGIRRWGPDVRYIRPMVEGDGVVIGGIRISPQQFLVLFVTLFVLVLLWALDRFTPYGLRLRATAIDAHAAALVGVNVNRTSVATWALSGGLAGLSAILIAPLVAFQVMFMTFLFIRGLAAALVGGLTSIGGAMIAGIGIGVAEGAISYWSPVSGMTEAVLAAFVLLLMLARPNGVFRAAY